MKNKNIELLKGSIKKWKKVTTGKYVENGPIDCPLCQEYFERTADGIECNDNCPIKKDTGLKCCNGTIYTIYNKLCKKTYNRYAKTPKQKETALRFVDYLEALLWGELNEK